MSPLPRMLAQFSRSRISALASRAGRFCLAVATVALLVDSAAAAPKQWSGKAKGKDKDNWTNAGNWNGVAPGAGDQLLFEGSDKADSNDNDFAPGTNFTALTFGGSADAFSLNGNAITLGGNVTNASTQSQTINLDLTLSGTRTFDAASGNLVILRPIAGVGHGIRKAGSNTLILTAANTFTGTTTIAAGTLQLGTGGTTGSLAAASSIVNNAMLTFNRSNTITQGVDFAPVISGVGGITKLGTNTLVLNGANTYTGSTLVSAGTLQAGAAAGGQAFGNLSAVTVSSGATLDLNGFSQTLGSLAGNGTVSFGSGNATLTFGGDNSSTVYGGVVSGTGSILKVGTGTFAVTNTVVPAGFTITVNGGTFQLGNGGVGGALTSPSTVINNATYAWNRSDDREQGATSTITGTGAFLKLGAGIYTLSGTNSYSGGTRIESGTLRINNASAIGASTGALTINGGSLNLANFSTSVGNLTGTGGRITSTVAGSRTLTIGAGGAGGGNYQGVIENGTGTTSLIKVGNGTITLSGSNTYTGGTTVSGGRLLANNASGSATGTGAVTVNAGGTFGGTGSIAGSLTVNAGGRLSPGASIQSLASGNNTWNGGMIFDFEFDTDGSTGSGGTNWDLLTVTGTLDLTGATNLNRVIFNLFTMTNATTPGLLASWNPSVNHTWSGFVTTTGGFIGFGSDKFSIVTTGFQNPITGSFSVIQNGNNLDLSYVAVPEPPMVVLLGAAGLAGLAIRRRRVNRSSGRAEAFAGSERSHP